MLRSINKEQRLYVVSEGAGYSCLGFDYAEKRRQAIARWTHDLSLAEHVPLGTPEHYEAYKHAMSVGHDYALRTKEKCDCDLTPELIGHEGKRVEVIGPDGYIKRFWVSRSMGWMPCHIEISRRGSHGGPAAYIPKKGGVRVVRGADGR